MVAAVITVVALINAPNIRDITCQSFQLSRDALTNSLKMLESSSIFGEGECDEYRKPDGFEDLLTVRFQHSNIHCHRYRFHSFPSAALQRQKGFHLGILSLNTGEVFPQKPFLVGSGS